MLQVYSQKDYLYSYYVHLTEYKLFTLYICILVTKHSEQGYWFVQCLYYTLTTSLFLIEKHSIFSEIRHSGKPNVWQHIFTFRQGGRIFSIFSFIFQLTPWFGCFQHTHKSLHKSVTVYLNVKCGINISSFSVLVDRPQDKRLVAQFTRNMSCFMKKLRFKGS